MKSTIRYFQRSLLVCAMCAIGTASADETGHEPKVVPDAERALATKRNLDGPTKNQGIKSVTPLGAVELGEDFSQLNGRQLRARELVIEPGGVVAVHQHEQRPGVAYILEGEIVEHRSDHAAPLTRTKGAVAFEKSGVSHWWENTSPNPVRALVVDIVPVDSK